MKYSRLIMLDWYDGFTEGYIEEHPTGELFYFKVRERNYDLEDEYCYLFWKVDSTFNSFIDSLPEGCVPQWPHWDVYGEPCDPQLDDLESKVARGRFQTDDTSLELHKP